MESEPEFVGGDRRLRRRSWFALLVLAGLAGGVWLVLGYRQAKSAAQPVSADAPRAGKIAAGVGCIGRVEPEGGVIVVAAAPLLGQVPVIARLLVKEGQMVAPGETIAILDSLPQLESAVRQADARIAVAQSRLAQLQAGPRPGDVLALKAEVARLESESNAARQELQREEALARQDFIPRVQVEAARVKSQDADRLFDAARDRLASLTEVRASDLNLARAELAAAEVDRDRARIEREGGIIRSPVRARVIAVVARAGEAVGPGGVVTLADTSRMNVVAEIYETDIARVHPGEHAVISSPSLPQSIQGVVDWISPQIGSRTLPVDPSAPPDQRVYQARIRISQPELLAHRIDSRVDVLIEP